MQIFSKNTTKMRQGHGVDLEDILSIASRDFFKKSDGATEAHDGTYLNHYTDSRTLVSVKNKVASGELCMGSFYNIVNDDYQPIILFFGIHAPHESHPSVLYAILFPMGFSGWMEHVGNDVNGIRDFVDDYMAYLSSEEYLASSGSNSSGEDTAKVSWTKYRREKAREYKELIGGTLKDVGVIRPRPKRNSTNKRLQCAIPKSVIQRVLEVGKQRKQSTVDGSFEKSLEQYAPGEPIPLAQIENPPVIDANSDISEEWDCFFEKVSYRAREWEIQQGMHDPANDNTITVYCTFYLDELDRRYAEYIGEDEAWAPEELPPDFRAVLDEEDFDNQMWRRWLNRVAQFDPVDNLRALETMGDEDFNEDEDDTREYGEGEGEEDE